MYTTLPPVEESAFISGIMAGSSLFMKQLLVWVTGVFVVTSCFLYFLSSKASQLEIVQQTMNHFKGRELMYFVKSGNQWETKVNTLLLIFCFFLFVYHHVDSRE